MSQITIVIYISSKLFATTPSLGIPEKAIALMGLMLGLTPKPVMLSEAKHLGGRPKGAKSNISVDALGVSLSFSGINTLFIKGVC